MTDAPASLPNGPGAAAILAAGIGSLALGVLAFTADAMPSVRAAMNVWDPTGALSGVTLGAIVIWLTAWFVLGRRWEGREVKLQPLIGASVVMLVVALLLTFPPVMDLLQDL